MIHNLILRFKFPLAAKATILLLLSVVFFFVPQSVAAQRKFFKSYPAGNDVRLELLNRSGTVTVEGWNRPEVSVSAYLEAPAAVIAPQVIDGKIYINLVKDNEGRAAGSVNFTIRVPYASRVDIETRMGNLTVTNVRGGLVRAHISSEGDITLTNIDASMVSAQNGIGNIFFDGEIQRSGNYRFASLRGDINMRIPMGSSFRLVATAPSTRNISLGPFATPEMLSLADGRRVVGRFGDGSASVTVTNQRGGISFLRR
jgi:hypothetical protein